MKSKTIVLTMLSIAACSLAALTSNILAPTDSDDFDYEGNADTGRKAAFDRHGNVYIAIDGTSDSNGVDIVVVKYDYNLNFQWAKPYDSSEHGNDTVAGIVFDEAANAVYVAGTSPGDGTGNDVVVCKINATTGNFVWGGEAARWDSGNDISDHATDLAIDSAGNLYVSGYTDDGEFENDAFVVAFEPNGDVKTGWPEFYGDNTYDEKFHAIAVNDAFTVVAAGETSTGSEGLNVLGVQYSGGGSPEQTFLYDKADGADVATDVAFGDGRVFTIGYETNSGFKMAVQCWSLSEYETPLWAQAYCEASQGLCGTYADGFVYAAGAYLVGGKLAMAIKLEESDGDFSTTWDDEGDDAGVRIIHNNGDDNEAVAIYQAGTNIYLEGHANYPVDVPALQHYLTWRIRKDGDPELVDYFPTEPIQHDFGYALTCFCAGRVFATGEHYTGSNDDATTLLYVQSTTVEAPNSAPPVEGTIYSGTYADLATSNNEYLVNACDVGASNPKAGIRVLGDIGGTPASEMCFEVESKVSETGINQRIQLWNYNDGVWVTVDTRPATLTDRTLHITIPDDPADFVDGGDVEARILFDDVGVANEETWFAHIDVAVWRWLD